MSHTRKPGYVLLLVTYTSTLLTNSTVYVLKKSICLNDKLYQKTKININVILKKKENKNMFDNAFQLVSNFFYSLKNLFNYMVNEFLIISKKFY